MVHQIIERQHRLQKIIENDIYQEIESEHFGGDISEGIASQQRLQKLIEKEMKEEILSDRKWFGDEIPREFPSHEQIEKEFFGGEIPREISQDSSSSRVSFQDLRQRAKQQQLDDLSGVPLYWPETSFSSDQGIPKSQRSKEETLSAGGSRSGGLALENPGKVAESVTTSSVPSQPASWPVFAVVVTLVGAVLVAVLFFMIIPSLLSAKL